MQQKEIQIDGVDPSTFKGFVPIIKGMVKSYVQKPAGQDTVSWLGSELQNQLKGMTSEEAGNISQDIMAHVDGFNSRAASVEEAAHKGISREEWLRNDLKERITVENINEYGQYLSEVNDSLTVGNQLLVKAVDSADGKIVINSSMETVPEETEKYLPTIEAQQWNKFTINTLSKQIVKQAELAGTGMVAVPSGIEMALEETAGVLEEIPGSDVLTNGTQEADRALKGLAAGALKIGVETGKVPFLNKSTPTPLIVDIACWGMEGVKSVIDVARGEKSVLQALEHMKNISVAMISDLVSNKLSSKLFSMIPIVGPLFSTPIGSVVVQQVDQKIKSVIDFGMKKIVPVAVKTVKRVAKAVVDTVTNVKNAICEFFGI